MKLRELNKNSVFVLFFSGLLGSGLIMCVITVFAVYLIKTDSDFRNNTYYLLISVFIGALIAGLICGKRLKKRKILFSTVSGISAGLITAIISLFLTGFNFSVIYILIIASGTSGGLISGTVTKLLR